MACGGTALLMAAEKIIAKGRRIAAHEMEADENDVVFERGKFVVAGTDKAIDLVQVARDAFSPAKLPKGMEPGLFETGTYDGGARNYPNGCHLSEVEIERSDRHRCAGALHRGRRRRTHDQSTAGRRAVARRHRHGCRPGVDGKASPTTCQGQLLTGSFMDYRMPRARDFCAFELGENEVPTKTNPLGVKGAGESGTVGALASVMNAINDALAPIGAPYVQMPATAEKIWLAIRSANGQTRERGS